MFSLKEISLSKIHEITKNVNKYLYKPGEYNWRRKFRLSWKLKLQELPTSLQQDLLVDAIKMAKIKYGDDERWESAVNVTDPVEEYMNIFPIPIWGVHYSPDSRFQGEGEEEEDEDEDDDDEGDDDDDEDEDEDEDDEANNPFGDQFQDLEDAE